MGNNEIILKIENLSKSFPGVKALKNINFNLRKGEVHALVGENGAGKSTFLKILVGKLSQDTGNIYLNNKKVRIESTKVAKNLGISMVYQEIPLVPDISVAENIFLGNQFLYKNRFIKIIDWKQTCEKASLIMKNYKLKLDVKTKIRNLSIGQQQFVEIIRAVSLKSLKILMMDEPTSALSDKEISILFEDVIERLKNLGISIIYITHKLEEAFRIADRITIFRDGEKVVTTNKCDINEDRVIQFMVGKTIKKRYIKEKVKIGEIVLQVNSLSLKGLIDNCKLELRKGEIVGIAGLMGSGRTELAKTLVGIYKMDSGEIIINGKRVNIKNPRDALKVGIAYLAEDRKESLVYQMDISSNITLSDLKKVFNHGILNKRYERKIGNSYIKKLHIETPSEKQKAINLSGGNQQKVVLARWLFRNIDIFILDEPTRGIDVGAKLEVYHLISKLLENGKSIILISSDLLEIVNLSDRVFVMHRGKIVANYAEDAINQENIMKSAIGKVKII